MNKELINKIKILEDENATLKNSVRKREDPGDHIWKDISLDMKI